MASIQQSLDEYQSGLAVTGVTIQGVQVPDQVQAAFDDAAKVRQDNDAPNSTRKRMPPSCCRARKRRRAPVDEAKTYSDKTVAQAQGDAERFKQVYAQYSKAPAVIRERMYLETMHRSIRIRPRCLWTTRAATTCCICRSTSWPSRLASVLPTPPQPLPALLLRR